VPAIGGDTMFASMSAAFEGLSDRMQHFISGLEAIHDFKPFRELFDDSEEDRKNVMRWELLYPPAVHPVVRVHPVTGRKVLFVNPQFTVAIKNMDERESKSLLDILFQQAQIPEYQFRHHWAPHTLIMWDNRSTQHYAVNDYFPQRRYMERSKAARSTTSSAPIRKPCAKPSGAPRVARDPCTANHRHRSGRKRTRSDRGSPVSSAVTTSFRVIVLAIAAMLLSPRAASAQAWPSRPVTMVVPFPAGGTAVFAREIAQALSDENYPG
jgi:Taurine catabolism dioxygenase TauD, TfdA family